MIAIYNVDLDNFKEKNQTENHLFKFIEEDGNNNQGKNLISNSNSGSNYSFYEGFGIKI